LARRRRRRRCNPNWSWRAFTVSGF